MEHLKHSAVKFKGESDRVDLHRLLREVWRIVEKYPSVHLVVETSSYLYLVERSKDTLEDSCSCKILW
jgi:hypothetical protein